MKRSVLTLTKNLWSFQGIFLSQYERQLHLATSQLVFVVLISASAASTRKMEDASNFIATLLAWVHPVIGILACAVNAVFVVTVIKKRKISYFFPHNKKQLAQVQDDVTSIFRLGFIRPHPSGFRSLVHAIGIINLLGVTSCGTLWLIGWLSLSPSRFIFMRAHKFFATGLMLYATVHIIMVLLHFIKWNLQSKNDTI